MPGFILHQGAIVKCAHGGDAQPTAPNPRVLVSGMPITTMPGPYVVVGCPLNISGAPVPCLSATWVTGATRVFSNGMPVLLLDSQAICAPNGTPVVVGTTQTRVIAT